MTVRSRTPAPGPQSRTYTVIGVVDLGDDDGAEPQILVGGVIEGEFEAADPEEFSGSGDRYARFCLPTEAASTQLAEEKCRAYLESLFEEEDEGAYRFWDVADQQIYTTGVYARLTSNAKAIFAALANSPEKRFTGEQLAAATGLKNLNAVAGTLSRPRVLCSEVGRIQCWWFTEPSSGRCEYWFEDVHAQLFLAAQRADRARRMAA